MTHATRFLVALAAVVPVLASPLSSPSAAPKSQRLARGLGPGVKFGASVEEIQVALRRTIEKRYEKLMRDAEDPIARRELTRRLEREVQALIVGHTKFDGQRTGMEVGIAGEEFRHGTGESVLRARQADSDRYYFFIGGKLWKVYSAYTGAAIKDLPFVPFLAKMRHRYGRPVKIHRVTRENERVVVAAEWRARRVHLEVRDRSEFFQSYSAAFSDPNVRAKIDDLRGKPSAKKQDAADALIELVTGGGAKEPASGSATAPGSGSEATDATGAGTEAKEKGDDKGAKKRVVEIY